MDNRGLTPDSNHSESPSQSDVEMHDMKSLKVNSQMGNPVDFNHLITSLRCDREIEFLQGIHFLAEKDKTQLPTIFKAVDNDETLLIAACKRGLTIAAERMLRLDADINSSIDTERGKITPIECACEHGNWKVLELLLRSEKLDFAKCGPLLSIVVRHNVEKVTEKCNYNKCFQLLLNNKNIDVNQLDESRCSALHHAVKFNNSDAIKELLKRGAYIGQKNQFDQFPISNMDPELLEKHLDSCISTNGLRDGEDDFQIEFDYMNLVPPGLHTKKVKRTNSEFKKTYDSCPNEITPIEMIAETNELRHLICHPLIASFVFLKWNQLSLIFWINFILCFLFGITSSVYILTSYSLEDSVIELNQYLRIVTLILTLYIIMREISQFRLSPKMYLRSIENYLEIAMIVLMLIILLDYYYDRVRRTIAATTLLLIGIELFHLAGSLPFFSFSTHYVMLKTVIYSFLKSLSLYSILLLSFSCAFFTLLREKPAWVRFGTDALGEALAAPSFSTVAPIVSTTAAPVSIGARFSPDEEPLDPSAAFAAATAPVKKEEKEDDSILNQFNSLPLSIIKTLVMSTGEFDAADIHFEKNPWSYIIFISFLFVISTVMLNLLNGLAVNDIHNIKAEAELTNFIHRCKVLAQYETALVDKRLSFSHYMCTKHFARDAISILKKLRPHYRVGIKPNANNQITIPHLENGIANDDDYEPMRCNSCLSFFGRCSRMSNKVVKMANDVLKKMNAEKFKIIKKDPIREEINELKASLEIIKSLLLSRESK